MKNDDISELTEDISEILLPNGSFYRKSPEDESLYLIDPATIGILAYQVIQFAANVFGATVPMIVGTRWLYKKYFPNEKNPIPETSNIPKEHKSLVIKQDALKLKLDQLKLNVENIKIRRQLTHDIAKILEYHGWMTTESTTDAENIVSTLLSEKDA